MAGIIGWNNLTFFLFFCRTYDKIYMLMWGCMGKTEAALYIGK